MRMIDCRMMVLMMLLALSVGASAADYYISSRSGDDARSGLSESQAWRTLGRLKSVRLNGGDRVLLECGGLWRETLKAQSGSPGAPITYTSYGRGDKPLIQPSVEKSKEADWCEIEPGLWASPIKGKDVGLIVFNHGEKWGFKKFWDNPEATWERPWGGGYDRKRLVGIKNDLDFMHEPLKERVVVKSAENPARRFKSVELLVAKHGVDESGCHDVVYDGLAVRYAGCHGFGGGSTRNIVIRNCDISWIGGALQFWAKDKNTGKTMYPVRFGNGIEFWGNCASNLVERCRIWEIYDAALTNQGMKDSETDIVWRDNVIWNSEYSFEYWNGKYTRNVVFEHNTCVNAGGGWGNAQRPDPNGAHLMFYAHPCEQHSVVVRDNLFVNATQWSARIGLDWRDELTIDGNLFWNDDAKVPYCRWLEGAPMTKLDYAGVRDLGFQRSGFNLKPDFVDAARRDYRLAEGSAGKGAATDGTDLGARQ